MDNVHLCSLCWRSVLKNKQKSGRSSYFCHYHLPSGNTKKNYIRDRRLISKAVGSDEKFKSVHAKFLNKKVGSSIFYAELYAALSRSNMLEKKILTEVTNSKLNLSQRITSLLQAISIQLPITYKKVKTVFKTEYADTSYLLHGIEMALNDGVTPRTKTFSSVVNRYDSDIWLKTLVHVLHRHELYQEVILNKKLGKPKGYGRNEDIRQAVHQEIDRANSTGEKVVYSHIAKRLKVSATWVGKIASEKKTTKQR